MENRYERQEDIVPREKLLEHTPLIVGVGAIGSLVAQQLVRMGSNVHIVDFDTVDEVNLATQGFREKDLGKSKVEALADSLAEINSEVRIEGHIGRFNMSMFKEPVIFVCVDSMDVRIHIFDRVKNTVDFLIDGRMKGGDTVRIAQARRSDPMSFSTYEDRLFPSSEAQTGSCTAKTTIYGAFIAAGFMVSEYARWLRDFPFEADYLLSLPATELLPVTDGGWAN